MRKVLVVDDEQSIVTLLKFNLENEDYLVDVAMDGETAFDMALENDYDFIILDLMLPRKSGMDVCRDLRQQKISTPILMLTAKDDELEKIIGLELGADDYMTKPFSPRELIARMNAIFRRSNYQAENSNEDGVNSSSKGQELESTIIIGSITIEPQKYEVYRNDELIDLTPKEFELLLFMAQQKNRILSRDQLLNAIWNYDYTGGTRIVDVHISHLREKLEDDTKKPDYIQTVRGFGYRLKDEEE